MVDQNDILFQKNTRIPYYDYSRMNYYFITICTNHRKCIFGQPNRLNEIGRIVDRHLQNIPGYYNKVLIDKYVIMPNHVHMILVLNGEDNPGISQIIGQFKTGVTKEIRKAFPAIDVWQRSFHDHIIRDQSSYKKIWLYIDANAQNWDKDCFYKDPL